jgi:hypothetical protein
MRDTRLILIEGLPGSGKSTAARVLAGRLNARGLTARALLETQPDHPLHVGGALHPSGATTGEALFARYTAESFVDESLARWRAFVAAALDDPARGVHLVESYPYQSGARVLLQLDAPLERILAYAADVEAVVAPLAPLLVYFDSPDPVAAVRAIAARRGPEWTAYLVALVARCPYAERRGLHGLDAVERVSAEYKAALDRLLAASTLPVVVLDDCAGRWDACYDQVLAFLDG